MAAVGQASQGPRATLTYYPRCTAVSTLHPDEDDVVAATASLVRHSSRPTSLIQVRSVVPPIFIMRSYTLTVHRVESCWPATLSSSPRPPLTSPAASRAIPAAATLQRAAHWLSKVTPAVAFDYAYGAAFRRLYLSGAQQLVVPVLTVSQIMDSHNISRLDLLKVLT